MNEVKPMPVKRVRSAFYSISLKMVKCGNLVYGLNNYDYEEGTLVFIGPGQVVGVNTDEIIKPQGTTLIFHPDLLTGTPLGRNIDNYHFFSYAVNEALHLSDQERQTINDCLNKIDFELKHAIDKHSKQLIVSNIELFLNYCTRFYDRQFITRDNVNKGIMQKFESFLNDYYLSDKPLTMGVPSVTYFAEQLNLSAYYFGDLIKKETGTSPQEYILSKVVQLAKEKVLDVSKSISEIAYELGFKYPQHFTRLFKQRTGMAPNDFRNLN